MLTLAHRIQLMPNNKQRTYFRKAIGCCRFAYNWGLAEWQRRYKDGERGLTGRKLRNYFNAIRGEEFPGPSEKFRGWGKPIQSAKYRNYTIES